MGIAIVAVSTSPFRSTAKASLIQYSLTVQHVPGFDLGLGNRMMDETE